MKRITFLKKGALVQKSDRLEIILPEGGIIQSGDRFWWFYGDPIPYPVSWGGDGYATTLDEAMRELVRDAMSDQM